MTDMTKLLELSQSADPSAALGALIDEGAIPEDRGQILQMLLSQQALTDTEEDASFGIEGDTTESRIHSDRHQIDILTKQVEVQQSLLHDLADAIGACGACFGADEDCKECGGAGAPGACPPDREAFAFFVRPALERMSNQRARRARSASETHLISKGVRK